MSLSPELRIFIQEHLQADPNLLLLQTHRYPGIDVAFAAGQIQARRQIREKLPSWYQNEYLIFPSRLSAEQCSSEITARYKQALMKGKRFCDLTGGLGIDTYYFSQVAKEAVYIERFPGYCEAAQHNFNTLGAVNIQIRCEDACHIAPSLEADTFYIDPARRGTGNKRIFALSDCEPDVLQLKPLLLQGDRRLILKISPMADLEESLRLLPETSEIHILAVKNECKEVLFVLDAAIQTQPPHIYTTNFETSVPTQHFDFKWDAEKTATSAFAGVLEQYLYEPNAAVLKSGAFKLAGEHFQLKKLHQHSHLYTSSCLQQDFPGRIFQILTAFPFSGKLLKKLNTEIPKANITTRNFPLTVAELRKRSSIKEGGDLYLFATTLGKTTLLILCHKVNR